MRRRIAAVRTAAPVAVALLTGVLAGGCSSDSSIGRAAPAESSPASAGASATASGSLATSTTPIDPSGPSAATSSESAPPPPTPNPTDLSAPSVPAEPPVATAQPVAPAPLTGALPTEFIAVERAVKDPVLGHDITVTRLARNLPWPQGTSPAQMAAFELVGVEMRWTPGTTYTAAIRTVDFALFTGSPFPNRPDPIINAQLAAALWSLLPAEVSAAPATGWIVVKVDPKAATAIRLDYTRPITAVTGTSTRFPKETFSIQLVG